MPKPIDIISRAMKDIGALASGETPSPEEAQDAFDMLNDLIDQWSNEDMIVFNTTEIIWTVVPGQTQYTIGPYHASSNFIGAQFTGSIAGNVKLLQLLRQAQLLKVKHYQAQALQTALKF